MLDREDIHAAADMFGETAQAVADDLSAGDVGQEEDFSGQLIGRIKGRLDGFATPKTKWQVSGSITEKQDGPVAPSSEVLSSVRLWGRQLGSKGIRSEESLYGADLLLVFEISAPDYHVRKGVLIQAKRLEIDASMPSNDAKRLRAQCSDMLDVSSESFVFLYASQGVTAVSAAAIEASQRLDLHSLEPYSNSVKVFFSDFLLCWLGDPRLSSTDRNSLAVLRAAARARNALMVKATSLK